MSSSRTITPGYLTALRVVVTLLAAATLAAAVAAGLLISGAAGMAVHSATAYTTWSLAVLYVIVALLAWWRGGGLRRPAALALGYLVGVSLQVVFGLAHLAALHVPWGVALFAAITLQLGWVWRLKAQSPAVPASEGLRTREASAAAGR